MAKSIDKRLSDLENKAGAGADEIRVRVNWGDPDTVLDDETGERVTPEVWRARHPGDQLIVVRYPVDD